jgi:hypothetical protein
MIYQYQGPIWAAGRQFYTALDTNLAETLPHLGMLGKTRGEELGQNSFPVNGDEQVVEDALGVSLLFVPRKHAIVITVDSVYYGLSDQYPGEQPHRRMSFIRLQGKDGRLQVLVDSMGWRGFSQEKNASDGDGNKFPLHGFSSALPYSFVGSRYIVCTWLSGQEGIGGTHDVCSRRSLLRHGKWWEREENGGSSNEFFHSAPVSFTP